VTDETDNLGDAETELAERAEVEELVEEMVEDGAAATATATATATDEAAASVGGGDDA
jgi:hypothetical protein